MPGGYLEVTAILHRTPPAPDGPAPLPSPVPLPQASRTGLVKVSHKVPNFTARQDLKLSAGLTLDWQQRREPRPVGGGGWRGWGVGRSY